MQYCVAVLELGLGHYQPALQCGLRLYADDQPLLGTHVVPDLAEAAARCGETGLAETALGRLAERAIAAGTPLALGLLARSRALLTGNDEAEPLYEQAIEQHKKCPSAPQLARAHLVYGEWLRRQRRRRDDVSSCLPHTNTLTSMGAKAFAERARVELLATGKAPARGTAETAEEFVENEVRPVSAEDFRGGCLGFARWALVHQQVAELEDRLVQVGTEDRLA